MRMRSRESGQNQLQGKGWSAASKLPASCGEYRAPQSPTPPTSSAPGIASGKVRHSDAQGLSCSQAPTPLPSPMHPPTQVSLIQHLRARSPVDPSHHAHPNQGQKPSFYHGGTTGGEREKQRSKFGQEERPSSILSQSLCATQGEVVIEAKAPGRGTGWIQMWQPLAQRQQ